MIWVKTKECAFKTVTDINMKQLENNKKTHYVFDCNTDRNISATSSPQITVEKDVAFQLRKGCTGGT
jgi:hypothetical protein